MGDEEVLSTNNFKNFFPHLPAKINVRWVEPFAITPKALPVAYRVDLPLGWRLYPVFHIDKLKHYIHSEEFLWEAQLPPLVVVEYHLEYEFEDLIQHQGKGTCQ